MIFAKSLPESNGFLKKFDPKSAVIRYLTLLISGFLMHRGRMSSQQAASAIATESRHRGGVSRFLLGLGHRLRFIRHQLAQELVDASRGKRPYIFILDGTDVTQQGTHTENTFSVGNRQRRQNNTKRYNKRAHRRFSSHRHVMGLLLTPTGVRIPSYLPYYTETYSLDHHLPYRTQADLGAQLISSLHVPSGAEVIVLGDTAFESKQVRAACLKRDWTWIMPANPERVLAGEKPRPKVSSLLEKFHFQQFVPLRLQPGKGPWAALRRTAPCRLGSKTKPRTYYVHQERRDVHSVGNVQIVFSTTYEPQRDKPLEREKFKILLCNDAKLSVESIVALYTLRWQIEMFFKELKSGLGLHQYRFRRFRCVEAWVEACLITYLYLEWIRWRRMQSKKLTQAEKKWWSWQRSQGIATAVRQRVEETEITRVYESLHSDYGVRKLRRVLKAALPTEYRHAA